MKKSTKVAVGIVAAAVLILAGVIIHKVAPASRIGQALGLAGSCLGIGLAALWRAGKGALELLTGQAGTVAGDSDRFSTVDGDPTKLDVWARDEGKPYQVQLPAGMQSSQVRAVKIVAGGKATVEILP